jgi:ABC-2 type transport system ATP-binding protein
VIAATGLTRRFGLRTVVNDVTFEVGRGEIVALLGPNGAGKTTTLRMLAGLIAPTSGTVAIEGVQLTRATGSALRGRIGFLTEAPGLWDRLTVRENLRVYAGLYGLANAERTIDRALETFGLTARAAARTVELSKGTRQKVALARALLHEPAVLLLDEPTSGLDPEVTRSVRALLEDRRAAGCAILVSTHNLDEAERLADRVAVLHERLLALDRPAALRQRLTTGRLIVRVAGDPSPYLDVTRATFPNLVDAAIDGTALAVRLADPERQTPRLVAALVAAGAQVLEVRAEMPALEDVYHHLMADKELGNLVIGESGN